jgi:hypothetical protein
VTGSANCRGYWKEPVGGAGIDLQPGVRRVVAVYSRPEPIIRHATNLTEEPVADGPRRHAALRVDPLLYHLTPAATRRNPRQRFSCIRDVCAAHRFATDCRRLRPLCSISAPPVAVDSSASEQRLRREVLGVRAGGQPVVSRQAWHLESEREIACDLESRPQLRVAAHLGRASLGLSQPDTNQRASPVAGSYDRRLIVPMLPP